MNIIPVKHEKETPSPHITFIGDTPQGAAMTVADRFGVDVPTVYQCGQRVFVPVTWSVEQHWQAIDNGV